MTCGGGDLYQSLVPWIKRMAADVTVIPMRDVGYVQAFLLLCNWPLPFTSMLEDALFLYSSLATSIGMQIGLHRADHPHEFSSKSDASSDAHIRRTTWLACFVTSAWQAIKVGVPCTFAYRDARFVSSLEASDIPPLLSRLRKIMRLASDACQVLGTDASNATGLMPFDTRVKIIRLFASELRSLLDNYWSDAMLEFHCLGVLSHMYAFLFFDTEHANGSNNLDTFTYV